MTFNPKKLVLTHSHMTDSQIVGLCEYLKTNKVVTHLNLRYSNIETRHGKDISDMISVNTTMIVINIGETHIRKEGMEYISKALTINMTLRVVNLRGAIGRGGARCIGSALSVNKTIVYLNIRSNYFGDEGAKYISEGLSVNDTLYRIDLRHNNIGSEGAKYIADALILNKRLAILEIGHNFYMLRDGVMYIKNAIAINKTLINVDLYRYGVDLDLIFSIMISLIRNEKYRFNKIKQNAIALKCLVNFQRRFRERQHKPPNGMYVRKLADEHDIDQQIIFKKIKLES